MWGGMHLVPGEQRGEIWGDVARCGEVCTSYLASSAGRYGEMWRDVGRCGEMWGGMHLVPGEQRVFSLYAISLHLPYISLHLAW